MLSVLLNKTFPYSYRKVEIKGKELRKGRGIKERNERENNWRLLMKLGNKMCMSFCCDDCIYVNILTCLVSRNLDQVPNIYQML